MPAYVRRAGETECAFCSIMTVYFLSFFMEEMLLRESQKHFHDQVEERADCLQISVLFRVFAVAGGVLQ